MSENRKIGRVQDYTVPFLVAFCIVLFCVLGFVWALYGFLPALCVAYILDQIFRRKPLVHNGIKPVDWEPPHRRD
ncbi:MAG: hypothetical protein QNI90_06505 [Dinoroseobacter sp.]|nr:hypothetical protein [Dinoroseobacter sp.]MDJ0993206.1 hypothetical protein [Dinoroseobacter sp.]